MSTAAPRTRRHALTARKRPGSALEQTGVREGAFTLIELPFDKLRVVRKGQRRAFTLIELPFDKLRIVRKGKRLAFTLIELLVVIVIILILASLLVPAMTKAIQAAYIAQCGSNMRQLTLAMRVYATDHMNRTTPSWQEDDVWRGSPGVAKHWNIVIKDYYGENWDLLTCPEAAEPSIQGVEVQGYAKFSAAMIDPPHLGATLEQIVSYGYNDWLETPNYASTTANHITNYNKAPDASNVPALAEANWPDIGWPLSSDVAPAVFDGTSWVSYMARACLDRHDMAVMVGFLDCHTERVALVDPNQRNLWDLTWHKNWP